MCSRIVTHRLQTRAPEQFQEQVSVLNVELDEAQTDGRPFDSTRLPRFRCAC